MRNKSWTGLGVFAGVLVAFVIALLTYAVLDQRRANAELLQRFRANERVQRQAVTEIVRNINLNAGEHRRATARDLDVIIEALRHLAAALGADPNLVAPPPDNKEPNRSSQRTPEPREPQPRPSSEPSPRPTTSPSPMKVCVGGNPLPTICIPPDL